jgi:hypothetical protein
MFTMLLFLDAYHQALSKEFHPSSQRTQLDLFGFALKINHLFL